MEFVGKQEVVSFINKWDNNLSPEYAKSWKDYKVKRDIVVKKMNLNEKDYLYVTAYVLSAFVLLNLKAQFNLSGNNEKIIKTRGNTNALKLGAEISKQSREFEAKCSHFIAKYNEEITKIINNRR